MRDGTRLLFTTALLLSPLWDAAPVEASNRWELMRWCTANTPADVARCEGFLTAALDATTHPDFDPPALCFPTDANLASVRDAVVKWLADNRVASEKSGLGLVKRALAEEFACRR